MPEGYGTRHGATAPSLFSRRRRRGQPDLAAEKNGCNTAQPSRSRQIRESIRGRCSPDEPHVSASKLTDAGKVFLEPLRGWRWKQAERRWRRRDAPRATRQATSHRIFNRTREGVAPEGCAIFETNCLISRFHIKPVFSRPCTGSTGGKLDLASCVQKRKTPDLDYTVIVRSACHCHAERSRGRSRAPLALQDIAARYASACRTRPRRSSGVIETI